MPLLALDYSLCLGVALWIRARRKRAARDLAERQWQEYVAWQTAQVAAQQAALHWEQQQQARWEHLCAKYGPDDARLIWEHGLRKGCSVEVLVEAHGQPHAIDEKVLKTKTKLTYKYRPMGANRYGLRVLVENGRVVGWNDNSE
mgnify:FL=1